MTGPPLEPPDLDAIEELAERLHAIYQIEAHRQNDVRYTHGYAGLPEHVKNYDRVLARFILEREQAQERRIAELTVQIVNSDERKHFAEQQIVLAEQQSEIDRLRELLREWRRRALAHENLSLVLYETDDALSERPK